MGQTWDFERGQVVSPIIREFGTDFLVIHPDLGYTLTQIMCSR